MNVIKVAIADDHKIFRKGVILSLRPFTNIKFVQEAENGQELVATGNVVFDIEKTDFGMTLYGRRNGEPDS